MLSLLQIRNFTIIESLDLELGRGFTSITGETGAGKSILVDALGLLTGGRADTSAIRAGCDKAELTAEFSLEPGCSALEWLRQTELDDAEACVLRRVISENGRSRAWINGTAVNLAQLQELGEHLVEIHGQNEHIRLAQAAEQFRLLDADPGCSKQLSEVSSCFADWHAVHRELVALRQEAPLDAGEQELLQYQVDELTPLALTPEAFEELATEHSLLARGSDVVLALETAMHTLEADEAGVAPRIQGVIEQLAPASCLDGEIAAAVRLLEEAAINCEEARSSLQAALSRIDLSGERLQELERTMTRLHDLARKHRVDPKSLPGVLGGLQQRLERSASQHQRQQELLEQESQLLKTYREASRSLSLMRATRATELSGAVTELLQLLGMEGGVFKIQVTYQPQAEPSMRGDDRIEILVSANPGVDPGPLRKVASGGELSRISLAVKVASSAGQFAPTAVFDEVDAGIGGATANAVGRLLQSVSRGSQALCVTHLAQVAVCADQQFRVLKNSVEQSTQVATSLLDEAERVDEIARMLGGRLSDQSRAHASELLASALTRH